MILLIGEGPDESMSQYLLKVLQERQVEVIWMDQNNIPVKNTLTLYPRNGKFEGEICLHGDMTLNLDKFSGIYSRTAFLKPEETLAPKDKEFADAERTITLNMWLEHTEALVINPIKSQRSNSSKPYQNWIVQQYGFKIPHCLVTNDPVKANKFIEQHKNIGLIYKSVSSERSKVLKVCEDDLERINNLSGCPTLFQSYVSGVDIRVHALATGETFATEIISESSDYRYDSKRSVKAVEISEKLRETCVQLTRDLGLYLSGIDIRRTPENDFYCFEVNPSPAFAWYEDQSGQPISEAVADLLINGKEIVKSNIVSRKF